MQPSEKNLLPSLRDDLVLLPGAPAISGEPRWLIYDRVRHKYFEITEPAFELLSIWSGASLSRLKQRAQERYNRLVTDEDVAVIIRFLQGNDLTDAPASGDARSYVDQAKSTGQGALMRAVHGYLFIKIPLFRPSRFLRATLPYVAPLHSRIVLWLTLAAGVLGIYLVSRQWDAFTHTFFHFFSMEGAFYYGLSLILIKTLHELAHAYTATRFGVRVPTMGVALMVLFPVLYTDVTDAWRLQSRKQKLMIAGAGIAMELAIACFATLAWAVLPEGPAKSIAFTLATSSWVLSLAVNLNPLMRFDGYYLLADLWGISNLQNRSFAIGRWRLREALFRLGHPPPDRFPVRTRNALAVFAFATWIYRFFLFLGIALLVYHLFFKALGIVLFLIEIYYFIALPVLRECKAWWLLRDEIMNFKRAIFSFAVIAAIIAVLVVPWQSTITMPAVLEADQVTTVFTAVPGRVEAVFVKDGESVKEGQVLARLASPVLTHERQLVEQRIELVRERLARTAGGATELNNGALLKYELAALVEKRLGQKRESERLVLRAPADGIVRDLNSLLHTGRWVKKDEFVGMVVNGSGARLRGLLGEDDLARIDPQADGTFIPDDPALPSLAVTIADVSIAGESELHNDYLASIYGGSVAVQKSADGELRPVSGVHIVRFTTGTTAPAKVLRGVVHVDGKAQSLAKGIWTQVMRVVVREANL